jgi:hypothetical protein
MMEGGFHARRLEWLHYLSSSEIKKPRLAYISIENINLARPHPAPIRRHIREEDSGVIKWSRYTATCLFKQVKAVRPCRPSRRERWITPRQRCSRSRSSGYVPIRLFSRNVDTQRHPLLDRFHTS